MLLAALLLTACSRSSEAPEPAQGPATTPAPPARSTYGPEAGARPDGPRNAALEVHVVDAHDTPLAGKSVHVFSERGGPLGSESSGADGVAHFAALPAGLVVALVEREPPLASTLAAAMLTAGGTQTLALALGTGGELAGQVVDDLGAPLAGAVISIERPPHHWRGGNERLAFARVAESDAAGRFRVPAVQSLPSGVWLVDGELRATEWRPVVVEARSASSVASAERHVVSGAAETLPRIVVPRPARLGGRVLDPGGRPVAGALVSPHAVRTRMVEGNLRAIETPSFEPALLAPPGSAGFQLFEGEVVTDADGRYELLYRNPRRKLLVWTPSGQLQAFSEPRVATGEVRTDFDLELEERCFVRARLLDPAGKPIDTVPPLEEGLLVLPFLAPRQIVWMRGDALLIATLDDGRRLESYAAAGPDGEFLFQPSAPCGRIAALEVMASGFETARESELARALAESRSYTLTPLPRLVLSVGLVPGSTDPTPQAGTQVLNLRACLAPPERGGAAGSVACCGLGARAQVVLGAEPRRVELPVSSRGPYWIYADDARAATSEALVRGPYRAGEDVVEILLPRLASSVPAEPPQGAPPPPSQPENLASGSLSFRAVRQGDEVPLAGVAFELRSDPRSRLRVAPHFVESAADGRVDVADMAAGPWMLRLTEPGFELFTTVQFVQPAEHLDLGLLKLQPLPSLTLDLRRADGSLLTEEHELRARAPGGDIVRWLRLGPEESVEGMWRLNGEATTGSVMCIGVALAGDPDGLRAAAQELVLGKPDEHGVVRLQLAPWRRVELRVVGVAPEHAGISLGVDIGHAADEPVFGCGHGLGKHTGTCIFARAEELAPSPSPSKEGERRFRALLYSGAWRAEVRNALYRVVEERFVVEGGEGVLVVELRVR